MVSPSVKMLFEYIEPLLAAKRHKSDTSIGIHKMKKADIPKIGLKAIVTETNAHWTVYRLYKQLCEEQKAMSHG